MPHSGFDIGSSRLAQPKGLQIYSNILGSFCQSRLRLWMNNCGWRHSAIKVLRTRCCLIFWKPFTPWTALNLRQWTEVTTQNTQCGDEMAPPPSHVWQLNCRCINHDVAELKWLTRASVALRTLPRQSAASYPWRALPSVTPRCTVVPICCGFVSAPPQQQ